MTSRPHLSACARKQRSYAPAALATQPEGRSTFPWCWHLTSIPARAPGRTAAPTRVPTPRRAGRHWRQPWARWRAVTRWLSPPAWPRSQRCSTSCQAGGRIVAPADCYFGVGELLADGQQQGRWAVDRVDLTDTEAVQAAVDGAALLWLETPSNPLLEVADLPALCAAGRRGGVIVGVDNTFATPLLQQPLAFGADVAVHSATKFIGGHSDLLSGIAIARDQALAGRIRHRRGLSGATPGALEAFLALRGLRTLALRLDRGQRNAGELARRLDGHPAVSRVRYPGLPGDPGHRIAAAQMTGFGAVLAFEVADAPTANRLCDAVHVIVHATSLGGVESTIERRGKLPGQEHVPPGLLRLSVGCEHIDDLWNDLNSALEQASRARPSAAGGC